MTPDSYQWAPDLLLLLLLTILTSAPLSPVPLYFSSLSLLRTATI